MKEGKQKTKRAAESGRDLQPLFLVLLFVLGGVFMYLFLAGNGNTPQVFTDVVHEVTSMEGSNKSAERSLIYLLSGSGALAVILFYLFYNARHEMPRTESAGSLLRSARLPGLLLFVATAGSFAVYGECDPVLFGLTAFWMLLTICGSAYALSGMISFIVTLYAFCGLYRGAVFLGFEKDLRPETLTLLVFLLNGLILALSYRKKKDLFARFIPVFQLLIPCTLLIFLSARYRMNGELLELGVSRRIQLPVFALILFFVLQAAHKLYKSRGGALRAEELLTFGTLLSILSLNCYSGCGRIVSSDLHHPFENIISFSQIFELGQAPFSGHIPVSGLYSVLQGAFLFFFGGGEYASYNVSENLFYLAVGALLLFAAYKQTDRGNLLFITLLFPLLRYNRVALILPVFLLLAWPELIKRKNLWLKVWLLSSLVHGLYYPLYGAAVCIGFFPLLLWQLISYGKSGELKKDMKKPHFWLAWAGCFLPVVLSVPLLMGTLKHMLAMSAQTVYADGMSRFGQSPPENFFAALSSQGLRVLLYDLFSFLLPAAVVWVSLILGMKTGKVHVEKRRIKLGDPQAAALCVSVGIAMFVAFSYTLVRMDVYSVYARSAGLIFAAAVMFLLLGERYLGNSLFRYLLSAFAVFLMTAVLGESVRSLSDDGKLSAAYEVPGGHILASDDSIPRLGSAFIEEETYRKLLDRYDGGKGLNAEESYLGLGYFGNYYLFNIRGASVMEAVTLRGYGAAEETIDNLREQGGVVAPVDSLAYYYLHHWLLCSGEYHYSADTGKFYPAPEGADPAAVIADNKAAALTTEKRELWLTPSSWGASMDSLNGIFETLPLVPLATEAEGGVHLDFTEVLKGEDADFLYLSLDADRDSYDYILVDNIYDAVQPDPSAFAAALMKKVYNPGTKLWFSWTDDEGGEHCMYCDLGRGELLVPLGSGSGWLLNSHDGLDITMERYEETVPLPAIREMRLLKLREVE